MIRAARHGRAMALSLLLATPHRPVAALALLLAAGCQAGGPRPARDAGTAGAGDAATDAGTGRDQAPGRDAPAERAPSPAADARDWQLAFPGAEGFGARTAGGRGGRRLVVTTLADTRTEGSLRWAVSQDFPRIVEFAVEGIIELESNLTIDRPFITIDGSTAPGGGVTLKDGTLKISATHDVIVRHLRVRPGDEVALRKGRWQGTTRTGAPADAMSITDSTDIIVDHVSASWSSDEVLSTTGSERVTVQNCFITEPLANPALHIEMGVPIAHAYGALLGGRHVSYIKNYFAYFKIRGPQMSPGVDGLHAANAAINNVVAFYEGSGTRVKASHVESDFVVQGNLYKHPLKGDAPDIHVLLEKLDAGAADLAATVGKTRIFVSGNLGNLRPRPDLDPLASVRFDFDPAVGRQLAVASPPVDVPDVTVLDAAAAEADVLDGAGATRPRRDPIDERLVRQYRAAQGKIILSQDDVGGYRP